MNCHCSFEFERCLWPGQCDVMNPLWFWEQDWPIIGNWIHNVVWLKDIQFEAWIKRVK